LVGTGPGDPDLLTVKAQRLLKNADVVIYDRLVADKILKLIPAGILRIFVGKSTGNHTLSQNDINILLANLAKKNRIIVRLKGGDPFIFGRGSEEALFLAQRKIPFEIVPGVTAATAVSTYAGIPLTHRGLAQSVQFITGHGRNNQPLDFDWQKLADPQTTLVIYMGLATIEEISRQLISAGLSADTPVAAIENGSTPKQNRLLTTLKAVTKDVKLYELQPPVLFVIGKVVRLAESLDWFITDNLDAFSDDQEKHAQG
jgi:uroporphyrin-III C-methyltransferase/precorrin-2 dehydrogenase/sirohydrochlorin ferrochelatase/uroporphyrin-III C-methyltransferase